MFDDCKNTKQQGNIGLGRAIAHFTGTNHIVSLPLNDSQGYDLIVDNGKGLFRVQVKTTRYKSPHGVYIVSLQSTGGNQSYNTRRPFDKSKSDLLYVLTDDGSEYVIPCSKLKGNAQANLGRPYEQFRVG